MHYYFIFYCVFSIVSLLHTFLLCLFFYLIRISGIVFEAGPAIGFAEIARIHFPESGISESASEDYQAVLSTVIAS